MISMFVVVAGIFKGIVVQKHKNTWKIGTYTQKRPLHNVCDSENVKLICIWVSKNLDSIQNCCHLNLVRQKNGVTENLLSLSPHVCEQLHLSSWVG